MAEQIEGKLDKVPRSQASVRSRFVRCLKTSSVIKHLVILGCVVVVLQQITMCIQKMINIPITTYTHFDFNKTLVYPSITFCRDPPYKYDRMLEHGLYAHPRFTSTWSGFNFSSMTLDELWNDVTYSSQEFFVQYGIGGTPDTLTVTSTLGFVLGRCITLTPNEVATEASRESGYSITLKHSAEDILTSTSINPPGYHVYMHYSREPFTELNVHSGGLVDYIYVNTGETLDVKLTVDEYVQISNDDSICTNRADYSANDCTLKCLSDEIGETVGCSGPWMESDLPRCANTSRMRNLITTYLNSYTNHGCSSCPRVCRALLYNAFVTSRRADYYWDTVSKRWGVRVGDAALQTQLYIHFNSMMVSVYEERHNYDWNLFISDLGGSIGFLLGLSVIGLMKMFGRAWSSFKKFRISSSKVADSSSVTGSTITTNVQDLKSEDYVQKCKEWRLENNLYNIT